MNRVEIYVFLLMLGSVIAALGALLRSWFVNARLKREYQLMDRILEMSGVGMWSWHLRDKRFYVIKNKFRIINDTVHPDVDIEEVFAKIHPDDLAAFKSIPYDNPGKDRSTPLIEYRMIDPAGGGWRWFNAMAVEAKYDADGEIASIIGVSFDISNTKRKEEALREAMNDADEANKAKGRFLAVISHEIRTPLNAIIGFGSIIKNSDIPAKLKSYADSIKDSGEMLLDMINELLDLAKIDSSKMELKLEMIQLRELLAEVRRMFALRVQAKQLYLEINCEADLPLLKLDPKRVRQVLVNLVGNAVKFTDKGGITVNVVATPCIHDENTDGDVCCCQLLISVRDTGEGISQEDFDKIFNPFEQLHRDSKGFVEGSGLGLAICKNLVALMGGRISFESRLGEGSNFIVSLDHVECANMQKNASFKAEPKKNIEASAMHQNINVRAPEAVYAEIAAVFGDKFRAMESGMHVRSALSLAEELNEWATANEIEQAKDLICAFQRAVEEFDLVEVRRISRMLLEYGESGSEQ